MLAVKGPQTLRNLCAAPPAIGDPAGPDRPQAPSPIVSGSSPATSPVDVYLATLGQGSRRTMSQCLRAVSGDDPYGFPWWDLRFPDLLALRERLVASGKAASTVNKHLAAVKGVLRASQALDLMSFEDWYRCQEVRAVKGDSERFGRTLERQEIESLYREARSIRMGVALDLLYGAGLRRREAAQLTWGDIHPLQRGLRLEIAGKGGKRRSAYLGSEERINRLKAALAALPQDADLVLGWSEQSIYDRLRTLANLADVERFTPHDLRRTFATQLYKKTNDIEVVSQLLGHASIRTTRTYLRLGEDEKIRAALRLEIPTP